MNARKRRQLEEKLTIQQRKAAEMFVMNEWGELSEDGKKKPKTELSEAIGIGRTTLYEWLAKEEFIEYINYLTDRDLFAMRAEANGAMMKLIRGGANAVPSVKALDLFYRRHGLLTDRSIVEDTRSGDVAPIKTADEMRKDLAELDAMMNG